MYVAKYSDHHVTPFRPIACTDFEMRYNNTYYRPETDTLLA